MHILINVPDLSRPGGVAALFNILKMDKFYDNVSLFILQNKLPTFIRLPSKYLEFSFKASNADVIHLNPSLDRKSFLRDALFAMITILLKKKLIVYWHGWEDSYEQKIKDSRILRWISLHSFLKADITIVLGSIFENKLRNLGYQHKIIIETNSAENKYIEKQNPKSILLNEPIRLLFLSRLETEKGLHIAIEALKILNEKEKRFILVIAGTGSQEEKIKSIIQKTNFIEWAGYVIDEKKHEQLASAHLMFFPTFYPEGLPINILEGMIYGLPIVSRPVGGIPDIVINDENGYLIDSLSPEENAEIIMYITNNPENYQRISKNNIIKSKDFAPENVRHRLVSIYQSVINN